MTAIPKDPLERYYTADVTARVLTRIASERIPGPPRRLRMLELGVGKGAFARAGHAEGWHVTGIDIDPMAWGAEDCDVFASGDALLLDFAAQPDFHLVNGNPPFTKAPEFVVQGLEAAPYVFFLLKSAFLSTKARYQAFLSKYPPAYVYPIVERQKFELPPERLALRKAAGLGWTADNAEYSYIGWKRGHTGDFTGRIVSIKAEAARHGLR